ncbi:stage III sporulation protein AE [Anaerocolumna sp. AGMB13025]|uniref:stage III sporulation protein AE n=1 Tax=Anaerocolumna sp. AGMB13025 TaxID=3039116 RepID=UPI00241EB877|nr:stage III sporulation protein AE [Anaerocolumna sp. AGMB13025]WFR59632.1 stage III sporulation protein AE [Anaerocolumna sp. AGMB13025]
MNFSIKKRRKLLRILLFLFLILFLPFTKEKVYAGEYTTGTDSDSDFDYNEIQKVIDNVLKSDDHINFEDYVKGLISGERKFSIQQIGTDIKNAVMNEIRDNIGTLTSLISIAVIAAVFTNFSYAFQNTQVAETGFYVAYLLLFSVLTASFISAATLAANTISAVLSFMKALVPAYFLSVAFVSSAGTSMVYYQVTLFLITFVDVLLIKLVIPMINIYLIVSMANNLSKEDLLSKLADLLSIVIKWLLKTMLGLVVGVNAIQGLILPVADNIKKSALFKLAGVIPGVGDVLGSVTESVFGAGVLLKNAIGVAGVIVIIVICALPIIKLAITTLIYRVSSAAVQPISDKRMLNCVTASADAAALLLETVLVGAVLFLLTITIIAATTT